MDAVIIGWVRVRGGPRTRSRDRRPFRSWAGSCDEMDAAVALSSDGIETDPAGN